MSSTVQSGGFTITSNNESAAEMMESLKPADGNEGPRVIQDKGKDVEPEKAKASEAARELGKRGGEAAAKAREARAKEAKTEEPAEPAEKAEAKPAEEPEEPEEKAEKSRARARVEQATRQLAEERRARAEEKQQWEERLAKLEERMPKPEPAARPAPRADGRPVLDDFATYEEYTEALTDWKLDQREQKHTREAKQQEAIDRFGKRAGDFHERIAKAAGEDGEAVKAVVPLLQALKTREMLEPGQWERLSAQEQASVDLADEIVDCERPLEVLHYLTENPDEYRGLVSSKDAYSLRRGFGRMLGRLEAQAEVEPEVPRRPSSAPPPLKPISTSVQPGNPDLMGDIPFDQYMKITNGGRRR